MIMINLSENDKNVTIEVTGHGDDRDQSCARVTTVLDCIQLFFSKLIATCEKHYGYTLIVIDKIKLHEKFLTSNLVQILGYLVELEELYSQSIKVNTNQKGENENGKNN